MRNTVQYPVEVEEVSQSLDSAIDHFSSLMQCGDIRPYSLALAKKFLEEHAEELNWFLIKECTHAPKVD